MQGSGMFYHLYNENKFYEKTNFYLIEIILELETLPINNMI